MENNLLERDFDAVLTDCVFPVEDNDFEIPMLDRELQASVIGIPFICWGEQRRTFRMGGQGTLHFYTEDYRFENAWKHPEKVAYVNPINIVEPNFSIYSETPVAMALSQIYRKRAFACKMQKCGYRILVDINVARKFSKVNLLGVPDGWRAYCTRGQESRPDDLLYEWQLAVEKAQTEDIVFCVYGGGEVARKFCEEHKGVYIGQLQNIWVTLSRKFAVDGVIDFDRADVNEYADKLYNQQVKNYKL